MRSYSYKINRLWDDMANGWRLSLFEDDIEVDGTIWEEEDPHKDTVVALEEAYWAALDEGENWVYDKQGVFTSVEVARLVTRKNHATAS